MSRIGLKPILLPEGVTVEVKDGSVTVKGSKGELSVGLLPFVSVELKDGKELLCHRANDSIVATTNHGTTRANIHNAVVGVSEGFKKELEISGIGYRCSLKGDCLILVVGLSHKIVIAPAGTKEVPGLEGAYKIQVAPLDGIKITVPDETHITVEGIDKQKVGQVAALIHDCKRPEPYGGKGIKYKGERILRKEGKRAATGGKK